MNISDEMLAQAIHEVLAHYYEGELEHYQGEGSHILHSLEVLKKWVDGREGGGGDDYGRGGLGGGGGGGHTNRILSYTESMNARQLIEALPESPKIPFKGFPDEKEEAQPKPTAPEEKKISSGSTTMFHRKLQDPNRPRSKWNKTKSDYVPDPLLGEAVVKRMLDDE